MTENTQTSNDNLEFESDDSDRPSFEASEAVNSPSSKQIKIGKGSFISLDDPMIIHKLLDMEIKDRDQFLSSLPEETANKILEEANKILESNYDEEKSGHGEKVVNRKGRHTRRLTQVAKLAETITLNRQGSQTSNVYTPRPRLNSTEQRVSLIISKSDLEAARSININAENDEKSEDQEINATTIQK
eukprot:UN27937